MNISKLTKPVLISELKERSLPTDGLKDDLIKRLKDAIENEKEIKIDIEEENYDSEDEIFEEDNIINKYVNKSSKDLNDDENTDLCKNDKKSGNSNIQFNNTSNDNTHLISKKIASPIIIELEDNSPVDNTEDEIIDISDEIVIDDEDHQEQVDKKELLLNDQNHQEIDELESGESRDGDSDDGEKIKVWIYNVPQGSTAVQLKELFGKYGEVVLAEIFRQENDCFDKCSGCVQLHSNEDVENCIIRLNQTEFRGNTITVCKDARFTTEKEKIQRMISPISSNGSWGGKSRSVSAKLMSPVNAETTLPLNDYKCDEGKKSYPAPFRGRGGYRGNNIGSKNYSRNDDQESRGRDYRRATNDFRGNYGSGQSRDEPRQSFKSSAYDSRPKDSSHRDGGGGRYDYASRNQPQYESRNQVQETRNKPNESRHELNESRYQANESRYKTMNSRNQPSESLYKPIDSRRQPSESTYKAKDSYHQSNESRYRPMISHRQPSESRHKPTEPRYEPINRDKRISRDCPDERYKSTRYNEDERRSSPKYGNTDRHLNGRSYKRPAISDYTSSNNNYLGHGKREEVPLKRARVDNSDIYAQKRRREDSYHERASSKHSFIPGKEYRGTDHRTRGDHFQTERSVRDFPPRKSADFGGGKSFYPPERRDSRVRDYPSDIGGRSRNFGR